jgi:hypothetical protein
MNIGHLLHLQGGVLQSMDDVSRFYNGLWNQAKILNIAF